MDIKDRFQHIISSHGISQQEMAERIGVDASTISYFCKGKRKPGFEILEKISRAFPDIDLNWLISGNSSESHISNETDVCTEIDDSQLKFDFLSNPQFQAKGKVQGAPGGSHVEVEKRDSKKIKRVIILFEDGTMESYNDL